jgi:hypothetical protein
VIASLVIAPVMIVTMISSIVSLEASRYLARTVIFRKVAEASPILIAVSIVILFG